MFDLINKFKVIDRATCCSYSEINELFNTLDFDYLVSDIKKGTLLHRATVNDKSVIDIDSVERLSYRKDIENIKDFGRANEPKQSIFYCADRDVVAIKEVSKLNRNYVDQFYEFEIVTSSIWRVKEDIHVVPIFGDLKSREKNNLIQEIGCAIDDIYNKYDDEKVSEYNLLIKYLSEEFIMNVGEEFNKYMVSCAFANLMYSRSDVDGISYPSVQTCGYGINSALIPDKIEHKIEFVSARRNTFILDENKRYIQIEIKDSCGVEKNNICWGESEKLRFPKNIEFSN